MTPTKYQIKSGPYAGMWHVRLYKSLGGGKARYFHVGRYHTESAADRAMDEAREGVMV